MKTNTIHCGNCVQVMQDHIPDNSIDLTVTSPPYDVMDSEFNLIPTLRDYNGYSLNFADLAGQLWRVTKEGGVVVWVVGDATVDGSETCTPELQKLYFKGLGFKVWDTMIYRKTNPIPQYKVGRYTNEFEYIFVLSKESPATINYLTLPSISFGRIDKNYKGQRFPNGSHNTKKTKSVNNQKIRGNIWEYDAANGIDHDINHPAQFPEALARDHIISWSNPGDIVLDPMAGSGTTLKMAKELGRQWIGIDISQEYVDLSQRRVDGARVPLIGLIKEPEVKPEQLTLQGT